MNINNTDLEKIRNSTYFSSYDGHIVVHFQHDTITSFAILGMIFLEEKEKDPDNDLNDTLRHESGHLQQEKELGTLKYFFVVGVPSVLYNLASRDDDELRSQYYSMPWEYGADKRAGIERPEHEPWAERENYFYERIFW